MTSLALMQTIGDALIIRWCAAMGVTLMMLGASPASAAVILGNIAIGVADVGDSNNLNGSRVSVGSAAVQVSSMSVYVGAVDTAPNNRYQVGIYTDANGSPGTLMVATPDATLTPNAWNTVPISAALQANTGYWLMYNSNGRTAAVNNMFYSTGSSGQGAFKSSSVPYGTWPASFGATTLTNSAFALYATAEVGGADPRSAVGEWTPLMNWPIVAINASVLKNGKVLLWDHEITVTQPKLLDPATLALSDTPLVNSELFCSGHTQLAEGQLLVAGGHLPNAGQVGVKLTYQYLPDTNTWLRTGDMFYDRWYPALSKLSDGRVAIFSGQITDGVWADTPEMYDPASGVVTRLNTITTPQLHEEEYPANFHLPNGKILSIAPEHGPVRLFDGNATTWTSVNTTPIAFGSAVQYRPGRILMAGGGPAFSATTVTQAAVLDMNAPAPAWRSTGSMSLGRYMHNLVMLPTGDVLAVGGSAIVYQQASTGPLPIELWSPATETWTTLPALAVPRMYHSTALLLPDGRVLSAGGGKNGVATNYFSAQLYSPSYLFRGPRPSIASAPDVVQYGASPFVLASPDAANIATVSLIGLASVTHSTDMNQSYTELAFTPSAGQLAISPPANSDQVPPGYYMLFIVDTDHVPSVAKIVKVGGASPPPSPSPSSTPAVPPTATRTSTVGGPAPTATHTSTGSVSSPTPSQSSTLGLTTVGSLLDDGDSNHLNGSRVSVGSTSLQVTSMSVHVGPVDTSPNDRYQVAIYTDSNGAPGTLVITSPTATLTANAWNTVPISAALQANTNYWLMYNSNGRTAALNNMHYNLGTPGQGAYSSSSVAFQTWPASFGPAALTTAVYSLYATADSGGGAPSPSPTPSASSTVPVPSATATRTSTATVPQPTATGTSTAGVPPPTATGTSTAAVPLPTATGTSTVAVPLPTATGTSTVAVQSPTPSPVPTTLGLTTIGSLLDDGDSNHLNGSRVLTSGGGQIVSMSVYVGSVDSNSANRSYQLAIYTDTAGRPGTRVATTATGTLIANSWNTLAVTATLQPNTNYWLMYNTNGRTGAVNNMRYNAGSVGQGAYSTSGVTFGTWPQTFPASTLNNAIFSLYATFGP